VNRWCRTFSAPTNNRRSPATCMTLLPKIACRRLSLSLFLACGAKHQPDAVSTGTDAHTLTIKKSWSRCSPFVQRRRGFASLAERTAIVRLADEVWNEDETVDPRVILANSISPFVMHACALAPSRVVELPGGGTTGDGQLHKYIDRLY
jgi:hypothetical protein